jgi:nucleotide-binding universal stress UspA family protein
MVTISSGGHTPSDALMSHAETLKADLVVAGAYGHTRIRELIFGSTTRNFLRNRTVPMLLSH